MNYFNDAKELIEHSKQEFEKIKKTYEESLHVKQIKPTLLIEIKNFMENLRSALDFIAHGLFDKYGDQSRTNPKIYFPYAWQGLNQADFNARTIVDSKIPGLSASRPDIANKIEGYQYFSSPRNSWLPKFMDLNNENKHQRLTPQQRTEVKELNISSGNVSMSIGQGASIQIGRGASVQIGETIIPGGQNIDVNNPAKFFGPGKQTVITWVSFNFSSNNEPVLPLLQQSLVGVEKIFTELSSM